MTDPNQQPVMDSFGNAKFTEDFRSEVGYGAQSEADINRQSTTLKKKNSVKRNTSVRRSRANSAVGQDEENPKSILHVPIPTSSSPTDVLVNRFQAWRRLLKDYITYFREVQGANETQAKNFLRLSQTISNQVHGSAFMNSGGILETNNFLRDFHKEAYTTAENARSIENEIINHLVGLRGDLSLKIKEIKALSSDFKNNVDKEKDATKKALAQLNEAILALDADPQSVAGKNEPYIIKLQAERQIRKQLAEEHYLHRAYLNLESSGRELEKIVVSEIQKAFETFAQILRREGQQLVKAAENLETNIVQRPQDLEWSDFIARDPNIVDPKVSLRKFEDIDYPGKNNPATTVVREGQLERRTKYLKSYAAGWYVLSATHLHEFKTPDRENDPTPIMSLYLPECTIGSHSDPAAISHKFVLKGRQTGTMHTRHSWTFRAESHAAMLEWYNDIAKLTDLSGAARDAFVTAHQPTPSTSAAAAATVDENDKALLENDEADEIPYSASTYTIPTSTQESPKRPELGKFPSDILLERGLQEAQRPTSSSSDRSLYAAAGAVPGSNLTGYDDRVRERDGTGYVVVSTNPADPNAPRHHSRSSSAFSYDETHPYDKRLESPDQPDVLPVLANISPEIERKLSTRHDYQTNEEALRARRTSSFASADRRPPSRKPTASYGVDPVTGLPDPSVYPVAGQEPINWTQFLQDNEARKGSISAGGTARPPPSRKPTASYGLDPITGLPEQTGVENVRPSNASVATRDIHVPGEYPREHQ